MKIPPSVRLYARLSLLACAAFLPPSAIGAQASYSQQLAFAGLRSSLAQGQCNAVRSDASGNLYLLLDQKDGVRVLKTDASASTVFAQAHLGAKGDIGIALALDPAGNVYITGTTTSGVLAATAGAAFASPADTSTNSFVAKFDSSLNSLFVTYAGSGRMAASGVAATANAVYITGSLFAASLPTTPAAILQSPATGSTQNGFVEKFNTTGTTLLYATYLTGYGGDTAPAAIAVDPAGDAFIAGSTSATGYPTFAAVVPIMLGASSGFLTRLTPNGDGISFSTFIPGAGVTSIAYDLAGDLLLSGSIALGQFPIASVSMPLVSTQYQSLVHMSLNGSAVLGSTLLAPGTKSFVTPAASGSSGASWVAGDLTVPLLPLPTLSTIGNSFAMHVTAQGVIDQAARFGGLPAQHPAFASAPVTFTSLATDAAGQPILAGSLNLTTSTSLLGTQTFDVPLANVPTTALPSGVQDILSVSGSAAYLAKLNNAAAPSLAFSIDDAPNIILRNLGSSNATNLNLLAAGFTFTTTCTSTLIAGDECDIALTGSGPGTITVQAANATAQTAGIPAIPPAIATAPASIVFSPHELDFGIQTASSAAATRTLTVTNLTQQSQTFPSALDAGVHAAVSPFSEIASDCTTSGTGKLLAPGATCHITLGLTAIGDGPIAADWTIGTRDVHLTGYTQTAALTLSVAEIDFGTQYAGGLRLPRYLYLSNNSSTNVDHTPVSLPANSPFTLADNCPTQLGPHTVCQLALSYQSAVIPSSDSVTLTLDDGLTALITGKTLPALGTTGASVNPSLSVTPLSLNFPSAVPVTGVSGTTRTVTVANTGATAFSLALSITPEFTDTTDCASTLAGGAVCSILVSFAPAQGGDRQGLLSIAAGAGTTPVYVSLAGVATAILDSASGIFDFGDVIVGQPAIQWHKITQSFSQLTAATTGDYTAILVEDLGYGHGQPPTAAFAAAATGTCFNCWLGVLFQPSATGIRSSILTFTSSTGSNSPYALALTGNGLPLSGLILTPASQSFGTVPVNSASAVSLFTLTNLSDSTTPVSIATPVVSGDFAIAPNTSGGAACIGTLAQNASCFVQVVFAPMVTGARTGTLTIQSGSGSVSTTLDGFGSPDPGLALNPTALIFNNVPGPTVSSQTIVLTNTGSNLLQIGSPTATLANFQPTTNCAALAPSTSCTITVNFTPAAGPLTGVLTIPTNTATYTVPLTGSYTTEDASLQIIPNQAEYGPTATGIVGATRQFTINNLTARSLALEIALPRQFVLAGPPCSGLAPNASCSFAVSFLPLTNGDITGTLFSQANPTDGSGTTFNAIGYVEGYGTGAASLAVTGNILPGGLLNFGQTVSGQTATQTLTLTNTDSVIPLTIRRITSEWPFLATSNCGAKLAYRQSCNVILTYTPLNQVQTGGTATPFNTDAGTLVIESDALSSPDLIDLTGQASPIFVGSPANIAPLVSFTASQSSLTFAATQVGNSSLPQTVVLSNTGTAAIHLRGLQSSADFTTTTNCATIVPGASCSISVALTPQQTGVRIGALEIASDSSRALDFISLIGTASPSNLSLRPGALDFGTVPVGSISTVPLQVTNTGATAVSFNAVTATDGYTVSGTCPTAGATLATAASCILQIAFAPVQSGAYTGTLSLSTSATTLPLKVALTGIGSQAQLQILPSTLDFGAIALGATANRTVTLSNTGNASLTGLSLAAVGDYAVTVPCGSSTIAAGVSCPITVTFTPAAIGTRSGALTVASANTNTTVPLTGTGIAGGSFLLTVDGGATSSTNVQKGKPATYTLSLTPQNNFSGTVVLNCTPVNAAQYATCSLLPSSVTLNGATQNATATLNTITSVAVASQSSSTKNNRLGGAVLCLLTPALFFFWRGRTLPHRPQATLGATLLTIAALATLLAASGCGGGSSVDASLRYTPTGTYRYQVTASSTSGVQITQTVTLNLTVQ